jgi:hypothetical protein
MSVSKKFVCTQIGASDGNTSIIVNNKVHNIDGSVSAPSYSFSNSTSSGIYSSGTNTVDIASNGVSKLSIGSSSTVSNQNLSMNSNNITNASSVEFKNSNIVTVQAQSGTGNWTMQLPTSAGVDKRVMQTNGSGVLTWSPSTQFGGVIRVDKTYGNDTNGSVGGDPFLTINAALAVASSGNLVLVFPGSYDETITIPSGVSVRGVGRNVVSLAKSAVTSSTTMVEFSSNSTLEDMNITLSSATTGLTLKGLYFPSTTSSNSYARNCHVGITNSSTGSGNMYAVHSSGTGAASTHFHNIRACSIDTDATGAANTIISKGVYLDTGAATFRCSDTSFDVTTVGSGSTIAAESNFAGSTLSLCQCQLNGTTADISQTLGTLSIISCSLMNKTANSLGFTADKCSTMNFGYTGAAGANVTSYLYPGASSGSANLVSVLSPSKIIIKSFYVKSRTALTTGRTCTVSLFRGAGTGSTPTAVANFEVTLTGPASAGFINSISQTFNENDQITVKLVTGSQTPGVADVMVTMEYI